MTLTLDGRRITLDALTDSGNLVRDPVSGRGVIFVARRRLEALVEEPLRGVLLTQQIEGMAGCLPTLSVGCVSSLPRRCRAEGCCLRFAPIQLR